jgi:hypothetical protein
VAQSFDVGAEQWRGVAQPHPRVHNAVVDVVAPRHRRLQSRIVENVPIAPFDVQIVDALGGTGMSQQDAGVLAG